jgi:hypothetical protein
MRFDAAVQQAEDQAEEDKKLALAAAEEKAKKDKLKADKHKKLEKHHGEKAEH